MYVGRIHFFVVIFVSSVAVIKGVRIEPCVDGVFEVIDNVTDNEISCYHDSTSSLSRRMTWRLTTKDKVNLRIGTCYGMRWSIAYGKCREYFGSDSSIFHLTSSSPNATTLTIRTTVDRYVLFWESFASGTDLFGRSSLSCDAGGTETNCTTDFVRPAKDVSCTVMLTTDTSPWSVVIRCDVSYMYSAMGRYSCQLLSSAGGGTPTETGSRITMQTNATGTGSNVSGSCEMTSSLPMLDGEYSFFVEIIPGRNRVEAVYTGMDQIRSPSSATLTHNCPSSVAEGDDVICRCRASDVGSPAGEVQWNVSVRDRLALLNVTRVMDSSEFTCQLLWNGQPAKSLTYRLNIVWPPSTSLTYDCPEYVTEGTDVECHCVTTDTGKPPATCQWDVTNISVLAISDVSKNDAGKTYKCQMTWNRHVVGSVTYTLAVYQKPTSSLNHTCPTYVIEGSDLDCSCVIDDVGVPPAILHWGLMNSSRLRRHNIQRDDAGTTFVCLMTWNGTSLASLSYTVSVVSDSGSAQRAHRRGLATGLGSGVSAGVLLLGVAVLVSVGILWRRGWVLPCSPATSRTGNTETAEPGSQAMQGDSRHPPARQPVLTPQHEATGETSNVYDTCDTSQMGVQSPYETLTVHSGPKRTKKRRKNKTNGRGNATRAKEEDSANYENVEMQRQC